MKVVICGGGIIGASIAYHLAEKGVTATVVERCSPACAASGKAGGFLARDWCDSYELGQLARKSFDMHMEFSNIFKDCDYRCLDTLSVSLVEGRPKGLKSGLPDWVNGPITGHSKLGTEGTTAQVHPYKLTNALLQKAMDMVGTELIIGEVTGVSVRDSKVVGVKVGSSDIPADAVVIAMGPWSGKAAEWLGIPAIKGQRAHSIIVKPDQPVTPHALFTDYRARDGQSRDPEIYPRPDGEVYVCGMGDQVALPDDPSKIQPNDSSCKRLKHMAGTISTNLLEGELIRSQACYLPVSPDGLPLIGAIPMVEGAYVATGHSCWGILNCPATGLAIAELIVDGSATVCDLKPFDPARFF